MKQPLGLPIIFIAILLLTAIYGCPDGSNNDSAAITLTVANCSSDKVTITHNTKASNLSGQNRWITTTTITVKCDGEVVEGAELKVKLWFTTAFKQKTDTAGQIRYRKKTHASPKGQKFKVTIRGNDGDNDYKTEEFTVP